MRFLKFAPASALLAVVLTVLFGWMPFRASEDVVWLEVPMESSAAGVATVQTWSGGGHWNVNISSAHVVRDEPKQVLRFRIPGGLCHEFRFAPLNTLGTVAMGQARVRDADGRVILKLGNDAWSDADGDKLKVLGDGRVGFAAGSSPHQWPVILAPGKAWHFSSGRETDLLGLSLLCVALAVVSLLIAVRFEALLERGWARVTNRAQRICGWAVASPYRALAVVAILSVGCSVFPVLFCGKSFLSPTTGAVCLYESYVTIPGVESLKHENARNSDTLAIQVGHRPWTMYSYESLIERGEFPLWNRYNSCGTPFLGNGLNMLGDPLHWPVILSNSASWAWDLKFVVARWLLAWGIGLCIWKATSHLGVAALVAFGANFLGFFAFRLCHPASFSLCYAPWIFFAWQHLGTGRTGRSLAGWAFLLLLACQMEFHSGTAKEAAFLIAFLNAAGALSVWFGEAPQRAKRIAAGIVTCLAFVLLNAPFWLVFFDSLKEAYSVYAAPAVHQVQPAAFIGLFDDIFFHRLTPHEMHTNPSANFLIFSGFLLALAHIPRVWKTPVGKALIITSLPALAFAFGVIPPFIVQKIPFIANISHVGNTFSCVLIVQFAILAGIGFAAWMTPTDKERGSRQWVTYLGLIALVACAYFVGATGITQDNKPSDLMPHVSPFFVVYSTLIFAGAVLLPLVLRTLKRTSLFSVLALGSILALLLFRHAQFVETTFDHYVINLGERNEFRATSPAVESLRPQLTEHARVAGLRANLLPGYNGALRLDNVCSADTLTCRFLHELLDQTPIEKVWGWRMVFHARTLAETQCYSDFLNVRYFLAPLGSRHPESFRRVSSSDLEVWESPSAWPRTFFTDSVAIYAQPADLAKMIAASDGRPFAAIQGIGNVPPNPTRTVALASNLSYSTNAATVTIDAPSAGTLVLTESWFEGDMLASVNGKSVVPKRVNHAFRGVEIPAAGHYTVEFRYRPRRLTLALWMSGAGFALAIAGALGMLRARAWNQFQSDEFGVGRV